MKNRFRHLHLIPLIQTILFTEALFANVTLIENWPFTGSFKKPDIFSERLSCPALTELNLINKKSQPLLLKELKHNDKTWILTWPKDLKWWDKNLVSKKEKNAFIEKQLKDLGSYKILTENNKTVISWSDKAPVGPFIFNKVPFKKKTNTALGYTCAGNYSIKSINDKELQLIDAKENEIIFSLEKTKNKANNKINFILGGNYSNTPWTRMPDKSITCTKSISLPLVSYIKWNTRNSPSDSKDFRIAATTILPRGNILRSGSGYMGTLVTYPNLKAHPGYNKKLRVRPYSIKTAKKVLKKYSGQTIYLRATSLSPYIKKTITEHFHVVGINVKWTDSSEFHGELKTQFIDWPQVDFVDSDNLQSDISRLVKSYKKSLSFEKPDFNILKKIHRLSYSEELFSILHSHRACVTWTNIGSNKKLPVLILRNPNWLNNLIEFINK